MSSGKIIKNTESLENSLIDEVTGDNLGELLIEGAEITLDYFMEEGVLKEIPFFGTLYKGAKAVLGIRERIFAKKVFRFLIEIKDIPTKKRKDFINKLEMDNEFRQKVGEKLIFLLEQLDDIEKPKIIGKLFKAAINERISYEDFLRLSAIVQKAFLPDLNKLKSYPAIRGITKTVEEQFVTIGIYSMQLIDNERGRRLASRYSLGGSNINEQFKIPPVLKFEINDFGKSLIEYGLK
jgi:hypothetical protein